MSLKKYGLWLLGVGVVIGAGVVGSEVYEDYARQKRRAESAAREQASAQAFAECAAQKLSPKGLRDTVMHHFQPNGIRWKAVQEVSAGLGLPPSPPNDLTDVFTEGPRSTPGMGDWPAIAGVNERCSHVGVYFPVSDSWRFMFWAAMTKQPAYQQAIKSVSEEDAAILATWREKSRLAQEGRDKASKQRQDPLFNDPK